MTDLDKIIEKINYARQQGFITQNEAQELRNLARSRANAKGDLGPKDRDIINQAINAALNKKGKEVKQETGLNPPTTGTGGAGGGTGSTGGGGTGGTGGGAGRGTGDGGTGGGGTGDSTGGDKWKDFIKGYKKFTKAQDRDVIRKIFGGNPESNLAFWQTLSSNKKDALLSAVKDGKIDGNEKSQLEKLFNTGGGGGAPGGGDGGGGTGGNDPDYSTRPGKAWTWDKNNKRWVKPKKPSSGEWDWDDDLGWVPMGGPNPPDDGGGDDSEDDGGGDGEEDDEPDPGPGEPTVKGGGKKIDIPKPGNRANYELDNNAQRLSMPNIDRKITREIERVTLRLINVTKEFIEGGMDFFGIDYVAENEILGQDGNPYYPLPDYNSPGEENSGLAEERAEEIKLLIEEILSKGDKDSQNYNYLEYLDLFELRYNGVGDPVFRFSLELTGSLIEDLTVLLVEEDPNLE